MKQFASKLAPYLKPFIKKLTTNYIKKQLTTDDNMKEPQNNRHKGLKLSHRDAKQRKPTLHR